MKKKAKSKSKNQKSSMSIPVHCSYQKMVAIGQLNPNPENPNTHPVAQVNKLAAIIKAHGWRHPITVSNRSGFIVSGHCRRAAAEKLGLKTCPCDYQDFKSKAEERAVLVADNIIGEFSEMDVAKMSDIVAALEKSKYNLELTALTAEQIDEYLRDPAGPDPADDIVPEPPKKAKTKTGDLYTLGNHRLLCGDSTKSEDVERLMAGEKGDMVFTDPPYGVGYDGGAKKREKLAGDEAGTSIYADAIPLLTGITNSHAALYLWYADAHAAAAAAAAAGYEIVAQIIWAKNNAQFVSTAHYHGKHEPCFYAHKKGKSNQWFGGKNEVTLWEYDRANKNEYHPTQKPVALSERAIKNSTKSGQIVLDPFLGSGSTLIAAEKLGRRCFGMEIDPQYTQICIERWEQFTGKSAILEATGQTFAQIKASGRRANV